MQLKRRVISEAKFYMLARLFYSETPFQRALRLRVMRMLDRSRDMKGFRHPFRRVVG